MQEEKELKDVKTAVNGLVQVFKVATSDEPIFLHIHFTLVFTREASTITWQEAQEMLCNAPTSDF